MAERKQVIVEARLDDRLGSGLAAIGGQFTRMGKLATGALGGITSAFGGMRGALLGLGAAFGASKVFGHFQSIVSEGAKLFDTAKKIGTSTELLSELQYAFDQLGASGDVASTALSRLTKVLGQTRSGDNEQARRAFRDMGISLADLAKLDSVQVFERIVKALDGYGDTADKAGIVTKIFGRGVSEELLPVLESGGDALAKMREEARRLGITISGDAAQKLDDFDDSWKRLSQSFRGLTRELVVSFTPAITEALGTLTEWVRTDGVKVITWLKDAAQWALTAGANLRVMVQNLGKPGQDFTNIDSPPTKGLDKMLGRGSMSDADMGAAWKKAGEDMQKAFAGLPPDMKALGALTAETVAEAEKGAPAMNKWAQASDDFLAGFASGIEDLHAKWTDFGRAGMEVATMLDGTLNNFTDAITAGILGTKSWKAALKDFAKSFLEDLTRMIVKLAIMRALMGVFGPSAAAPAVVAGEKGGYLHGRSSGWQNIPRMATGGIVSRPMVAMVGEGRNSEAVVPLPDNRSIPVQFTNGGGGGGTVNIHITAMDARDVKRLLIEQRTTLSALWSHEWNHSSQLRQQVRGA